MLTTFLRLPTYEAVGIALASDVLASDISAYIYGKNKNLDIRNGLAMMVAYPTIYHGGKLDFQSNPQHHYKWFSVFMTLLLGIRFLLKPVMTTKADMLILDQQTRLRRSIGCGILIGLVCSFIEAGGGMMMLLVLTSALGYELKTAVGTIVFVMTFTALTGALSHFAIGGAPDIWTWYSALPPPYSGLELQPGSPTGPPAYLDGHRCRHSDSESALLIEKSTRRWKQKLSPPGSFLF